MYTPQNIYYYFKKAANRPFRMPKDFDQYLENKITGKNKENLTKITQFFNTKWMNIDPLKYFQTGYQLLNKGFSYHKFFEQRILDFYIQSDKVSKMSLDVDKKKIINSFNFIIENKDCPYLVYIDKILDDKPILLVNYLSNNIDKFTFFYFVYTGQIKMKDDYWALVPEINNNINELKVKIEELLPLFKKIVERIS